MTLKEILTSDKLVLVDFFSADCPPCIVMEEVLSQVEKQLQNQCDIYTVDQVKHSDVFTAFGVKTVPHLKLFKKGKPIWEGSGLFNGDELISTIKKHL